MNGCGNHLSLRKIEGAMEGTIKGFKEHTITGLDSYAVVGQIKNILDCGNHFECKNSYCTIEKRSSDGLTSGTLALI